MSRSALVLSVLIVALGIGAFWLTTRTDDASIDTSVAVADAMGSDTTGYRRAATPRAFVFPEDHGPHPGFKTEWWYLTGNLSTAAGRRIGYQWTLFRVALNPPDRHPMRLAGTADTTSWQTNQFYMGHFAISDVANEQHYDAEQFERVSAGLAGAQAEPFRVWLGNWSIEQTGSQPFPARLRAHDEAIGLDIVVNPVKPHVLQGKRGLSQKGPGTGNASYYYSYTRMNAEGIAVVEGDTLQVTGSSWMDREWSTSALGEDQVGWDWFSLQLDDGRDLMYYQLRKTDGTPSRFSEGVVVAKDGSSTPIGREDVTLEVLERWTTPDGSRSYPVRWRLQVPAHGLDLPIEATFPNQEMNTSVRYWEGAVTIDGDTPGRGYVEMTGYGDSPASRTS